MKIVQPYKHDCLNCKWIGWITIESKLGNMYLCMKGHLIEIIIRWSDAGPDYSCYSVNTKKKTKPNPIQIM
jgi:hypothetical protein